MRTPLLDIQDGQAANIGVETENLQVYLSEVNTEAMRERMGKERHLYRHGPIECTQGQAFKSARVITQGSRYLYRNALDEIVGAVNVTRIRRTYVVSNIFVRRDWRRQGIASALIDRVKGDLPRLVLSSQLTPSGACFFGHAPAALVAARQASETVERVGRQDLARATP